MKAILNELIDHRSLTKETARNVLIDIASGKYNLSLTTAFMTVYMMRSITVDELQGFRDAMLELCIRAEFDQPVMDVCGTGGDGKNTFNISTLSSFVVAAAGQTVAKHGNYGVSSPCGSSNVLEHFGYKFTNDIDELKRSLDRANICFMHAPLFHPAMKNVAPVRKDLGVKTFFNMLGPMVNPAFPKRQLVGVFNLELARMYGYLYQNTSKDFLIVHSLDGYDEVSLTCPAKFFYNEGERIVEPQDFGFSKLSHEDIKGGDTIEDSSKTFINVLENKGTEAQKQAVIANAAMALYTANRKQGLSEAVEKAREALESGNAMKSFKSLLLA
ncbi:anthranilate phosphoribosyltransferase [Chryseosolibacter indicus]|uniref:Anthranilate phosphoribosyltransferase n=1 Tax=Chryseosolibacter indicus TaxID=2782351 RepID=A0ABS5VP83_9BACT|nr:anthranilate phosphoribosyltransferase [Chryseosolibacter indicus]MBT1703257.1 anthranilate phosphoribosyltransferase [Chryseosolibacter indicus]